MKTWTFQKTKELILVFKLPFTILLGIIFSLFLQNVFNYIEISKLILLGITILGSFNLFRENLLALLHGKYALDYIALFAILVGIISSQYLVSAIIVLMLSGGITLEAYGTRQAKQSLTALVNRIPDKVSLWHEGSVDHQVPKRSVMAGQEIFVRKGEVVPLDGILASLAGLTDESSLTGEPYMIDKIKGDVIRSGTVNVGNAIVVRVIREEKDSTYRKIIEMVQAAQREKAPLIRLANKYSTIFTIITLLLALTAFILSHDFSRVLAILVIATPCPLILATPIALMGGMSASAKRRIIIKKLSSIEVLSRVNTIIFDKTGTLTLGKPSIKKVTVVDRSYPIEQIYSIAEAIERNSLHPLAKAVVDVAKAKHYGVKHAKNVVEMIGSGIKGEVDGAEYQLSKVHGSIGMAIQLSHKNKQIAVFAFEDKIKENSKEIIEKLQKFGIELFIFTGDKKEAAQEVANQLGGSVIIKAECTPEDKKNGIEELKRKGMITAMVGDGINDAPALALADVGMVFSNEEQTAASEAADIVFLGGDFSSVIQVMGISKRTIHIALESILAGIGISTLGMVFAALGWVPPILGAFIQESIDVLVIINALRASRQ